jgi:LysM repeat protein
MNSLKTLTMVVVLAAAGYVVYVALHGNHPTEPPPGAPKEVAGVPKVDLPQVGTRSYTTPDGAAVGAPGGEAPPFVPGKATPANVGLPAPGREIGSPPGQANNTPMAALPDAPPGPGGKAAADPPAPAKGAAPADVIRAPFKAFIEAARAELEQGHLTEVLEELSKWYNEPRLTEAESRQLVELLDQVAGTVVYSREHLLEAPYEVRPGDTLAQIARNYDVPPELLAKINGIRDPDGLRPGQPIKVVRGPFHAVIHVDTGELTLMLQGRYYAGRFRVELGGKTDLVGEYEVLQKTPPKGSSANDLAIVLDKNIAIRAASAAASAAADPAASGRADPRGLIQVDPRQIEDVYDILSVGSRVLIRR